MVDGEDDEEGDDDPIQELRSPILHSTLRATKKQCKMPDFTTRKKGLTDVTTGTI